MFNNYKIIDKNGEKILILYIDYLYEFGIDFKKDNKHSNMKTEIRKIIKKINFNGEKIALMIGGILLATILVVENPKPSNNLDLIYVTNNIIPITKLDVNYTQELVENELKEEVLEEKNEEHVEKRVDIPVIKENIENNILKKEENKEDNLVKLDNKEVTLKVEEINIEEKLDINDNSTKVVVYRNNGTILELDLEEYLIGVVGAEMPASFNIEALKVQAIISRTYALRSIEIGRKLTDDVKTQAYNDDNELRSKWGSSYDKYYNKIKEAVFSTRNLAIYYNNKYIDALFFSTSNGKTEDSKYVWGNEIPYLKSVDSSWDIGISSYLREVDKDLANVLSILGVNTSDFNIISRNESGRVLEISVGGKTYTGVEFRNLLGLRSADCDMEVGDNTSKFTTRGYGHGVGLSQYGANGMANSGYNYQDIIKHYYTGVEIK